MRDYYNANNVPVSQMTTAEIEDCLRTGVELVEPADARSVEAVYERLRLELFIRANGLRTV